MNRINNSTFFYLFQKLSSAPKSKISFLLILLISLSGFAENDENSKVQKKENKLTSAKRIEIQSKENCGEQLIVFKELIYKTVYYENRCWLDRNLGAKEVPKSMNDNSGYGNYFQWGRMMDGHEDYGSQVSFLLSGIDNPGMSSFTTNDKTPNDWRVPQNDSLWQKTLKTNNPCPEGWRVPTLNEWGEVISNWGSLWEAFNSPLKIPASGFRNFSDGSYQQTGKNCLIWTSTYDNEDAYGIFLGNDEVTPKIRKRATGLPVRCIQSKK